ncbi:mannose-1-phosphate guanylyltransferase/mannose-6-phosphate isomerase [Phorcysia thermohydrogeniphila]|uniref:mannose-1-phosphate guanylyltransferase n=1 Tax=Phorcysia thermohydrogeniphila TaxID=936138 RepID=A0A4R1GEM9_9BACT|nr:mannose-1-phosphate guanylyltransferase/mannose-6-phosphate isomerase [Phorcysia thermohydrogeniphila]TCK05271.1 mannose-1-phosphate guanylyltransferase/mannose-6-phosphate isomerase [Phorcysia thermohydrogeniphila]
MKIVILAGGSGTRLFPLSREKYPKQFIKLINHSSFFQETVKRFTSKFSLDDFIFSTKKYYTFMIKEQLEELKFKTDNVHFVLEPIGRNTAPAIALCAKYALDKMGVEEEEVLFVTPSDHFISPRDAMLRYFPLTEKLASQGYIVTFGIKPSHPETGYGYIKVGEQLEEGSFKVEKFTEKPDFKRAVEYVSSGEYFWNSGMFAFTIKTLKEEFQKYQPEIYSLIFENSYEEAVERFEELPDISIDYAIMENTDRAAVIPCDVVWSDIGSWDAVYEVFPKDEDCNVKKGNVITYDTKNSMIIEKGKRLIVTIGVEDLTVIGTRDVTLILKRGESQRVKEVVKLLKKDIERKHYVDRHVTEYRPWGSFTDLEVGDRYRIKLITVKPGEQLSLQMHYHRSEHWIVVKGTAKVTIEDKTFYVHENESVFVPKTTVHRLENPGKVPLVLIEVQVGEYIEEDDIVRFEDKYGRV